MNKKTYLRICADCGVEFESKCFPAMRCPACAKAIAKQRSAESQKKRNQVDRDTAQARKATDQNYAAVCSLYKQGYSRNAIGIKLSLSRDKVRKILVDAELIAYPETELFRAGYGINEIAAVTGKSRRKICSRIPYAYTPHNATNPSLSAENTRRFRTRKKGKED